MKKAIIAAILAIPTLAWGQANPTAIADLTLSSSAQQVCTVYNAFRYACSCTNKDSSIHARWGDSAVTTTKGQQVRAGTSIQILSRGAIYFIAESGSPVLTCTEESR